MIVFNSPSRGRSTFQIQHGRRRYFCSFQLSPRAVNGALHPPARPPASKGGYNTSTMPDTV